MKIKRLEMVGFKSFVDKTVVSFDHDVMAIVGPNGCGKSNIVDAIRWCMGEQSAKHLRGRSMEDVIFSGSESRAGHEWAEVTLTFENDSGDVPIEYKDYAELAITRRLHRNGDSDYLINKTPVRLKDITDLFLGTGAGTKAYSIVEQGKIGLIVSAKPEDRRLLIEEAAGITKYKARKKQAERKMELTQQNLDRVGDIVAEIERNLGSLRRQAAKAERYLSYRSELEDLQLYEASHKYLEAVGWIALESNEVARVGLETDEARTALTVAETDLETLRLTAHEADDRLAAAQDASFAAENEARAEEAAIERAKDKLQALRDRETQAAGETAELHAQAARLSVEREAVAELVSEHESRETEEKAALDEHQTALTEVEREHAQAESRALELRQNMGEAQATIARATAKLEGFERRTCEMATRKDKLTLEEEELTGLLDEHRARAEGAANLVAELESGKAVSAEDQARAEEELLALRLRASESERTLEQAKGELGTSRSRMHALGEIIEKREGVGKGARALLASHDETVCGMLADRVEAPEALIPALAALLGADLENVVVRDLGRGMDLLAGLAARGTGRATILPLVTRRVVGGAPTLPPPAPESEGDDVVGYLADALRFAPEDEALVRGVVGNALVVRDSAAAIRLRTGGFGAALVTLDGLVLHDDGRVSGGSGEDFAAHMLETQREARELGERVAAKDLLVSQLLETHRALRGEVVQKQTELDAARKRAHEGELALVSATRDHKAVLGQIEQLERRARTVASELAELEVALTEAAAEAETAERELGAAQALLAEASAHTEQASQVATFWRGELDQARVRVTEHKVKIAGTREKLAAERGTLSRLARSTEELKEREARLEAELVSNARFFGEQAAVLVSHKERLTTALDAARERADALAAVRVESEALRAELGTHEGALREMRQRLEACKEELVRHEMALREQEMGLRHLLESVTEKFRGLNLLRVVGDHHMKPPPNEETHARIAELATLIDRMGSVNLDAVREHEEAEKRFVFYTEQKADLDRALADLTRAIGQMNRESKRLFAETFELVNARFQEVFPRMFRGGRAALRLTNPEDMLETGIDILAQPPGKKLSSIELMSGGEKALTAVSLIFAIFQIKPSPFCILDEVDAPLDEANVARYNELIRSMTDRSQFILITHIKRTMQLADVLYGVTMQESGVSRLVSVKMNAAAAEKKPPQQVEAVA
jgi:chromosome segregation protein